MLNRSTKYIQSLSLLEMPHFPNFSIIKYNAVIILDHTSLNTYSKFSKQNFSK